MSEDDEVVDIGKWFKKSPKKKEDSPNEHHESHSNQIKTEEKKDNTEKIQFDFSKHSKWIIPLVIIIIVFSFAFHLRALPGSIPLADRWAENSVHSFYQSQISDQVTAQFPNLPEENRKALVDAEFAKVLSENKQAIDQQIASTATQFRNQFKDSTGQTYLLGIDPYYYYRQTELVLKTGSVGTSIKDGEPFDSYKLAPVGSNVESNLHPYIGAIVFKVMSIFTDISVMGSFFFVGALISALAIIPAFFIGRRVGGNVGGFFAAWMTAVNVFFVSRTAGESSDTDAYNVFFPLLIAWLFIETIEQKDTKKRLGLATLTGLAVGLYAFTWTGWWFVLYFILAALGIVVAYHLVSSFINKVKSQSHKKNAKDMIITGATIIFSSFIFTTLFTDLNTFNKAIRGPLGFIQIKAVAQEKIWPNVLTTVAELNPQSFSSVIDQMGGTLIVLLVAVGILLTLTRKIKDGETKHYDLKYVTLFGLWLIMTLWSTTKGVRFTLLAVPAVAVGFGFFCGIIYQYGVKWMNKGINLNKTLSQVVIIGVLLLLIIQPTTLANNQAHNSVPAVNDAWWDSLTKIKEESQPDAIITSWWDFGHWFKAIADRPVTFDGGSQNTPNAYWVGKMLLTPDEDVAFGILRMLDCGSNNAFKEVDKKIGYIPSSVEIVNEIILQDKTKATQILKQKYDFTDEEAEAVTQNTHCTPPEGYVIASSDMVGKAGVWGHFGAWDFQKAAMVSKTRKADHDSAITILTTEFNLSSEEAEQTYQEIMTNDPNRWISPWPGYFGGTSSCQKQDQNLLCKAHAGSTAIDVLINLDTMDIAIPTREGNSKPESFTFATPNGIQNQKFEDSKTGFGVLLIPQGDEYVVLLSDPLQAKSMFAQMYYYGGHGLRCFDTFDSRNQFNSGPIYTYKADWSCSSKNNVFFQ